MEALASALAGVLPGLEVLDQDLDLGEGRAATLVAIDASGRLVFVVLLEDSESEALLTALDAWAFFRRNRSVLGRHFHEPRLRPALQPLITLVAEEFSPRMLDRLSGLRPDGLQLLEIQTLTSSRERGTYLVPLQPLDPHRAGSPVRDGSSFVQALPEPTRALGELLVRRVDRIDDALTCTASERAVSWQLAGEVICCVLSIDGRLEGHVPPRGGTRGLASAAQVEAFVDEVLERYVDVLREGTAGEGELDVEDGEPEVRALSGMGGEPLLSQEELEAFRMPTQ